MVKKLRLAWKLLARAAGQRQAVWAERKSQSEGWVGIPTREVQTWLQEEVLIWDRLNHLAAVPESEGRQLGFWATVASTAEKKKLPPLKVAAEDLKPVESELRDAFRKLKEETTRLRNIWDLIEDRVRRPKPRGATVHDQIGGGGGGGSASTALAGTC